MCCSEVTVTSQRKMVDDSEACVGLARAGLLLGMIPRNDQYQLISAQNTNGPKWYGVTLHMPVQMVDLQPPHLPMTCLSVQHLVDTRSLNWILRLFTIIVRSAAL